jgi:hypothetical protein
MVSASVSRFGSRCSCKYPEVIQDEQADVLEANSRTQKTLKTEKDGNKNAKKVEGILMTIEPPSSAMQGAGGLEE